MCRAFVVPNKEPHYAKDEAHRICLVSSLNFVLTLDPIDLSRRLRFAPAAYVCAGIAIAGLSPENRGLGCCITFDLCSYLSVYIRLMPLNNGRQLATLTRLKSSHDTYKGRQAAKALPSTPDVAEMQPLTISVDTDIDFCAIKALGRIINCSQAADH